MNMFNSVFISGCVETMSWRRLAMFGSLPQPRAGHTLGTLPDGRYAECISVFVSAVKELLFVLIYDICFGYCFFVVLLYGLTVARTCSVVLFGGDLGTERVGDIALFYPELATWHRPLLTGPQPTGRCIHAAALLYVSFSS